MNKIKRRGGVIDNAGKTPEGLLKRTRSASQRSGLFWIITFNLHGDSKVLPVL